ncbi:MAG TPA: ADP-forming succinate--CoA ligase subunit beta [Burkholderiales bacterium]|nr:ADP-forming succinate--CoA ligase subunit beta [Burkholderiales bacterium]
MKIHEYQAKAILIQYGVPTPKGFAAFSVNEAHDAAKKLPGNAWVVKAQIHAGGRGKGGGVKVAKSIDEVGKIADSMLGMKLITAQTGAEGRTVKRLLIEEGADIRAEYYAGLVVDRVSQRVVLIGSSEGGTEIEEVAKEAPDRINRIVIDPGKGLTEEDARELAGKMGIPENSQNEAAGVFMSLYRAFVEKDAMLLEVNPLILDGKGRLLALDAKFNFDDNALFRHPEITALRDMEEEDPAEVEASQFGLSYISLDGDIGCLVNGAGLAMATMDIVKLYGASPANFLDVGGGAGVDKVTEAFKLMLANPRVKVILVNIFGGIMKCDVIAEGIVAAARQVALNVPLVVRLEGTNVDLGKKILAESGLPIISANTMMDDARLAVEASRGH